MTSKREEWNDRALDQLDGRVENSERDIDDLRAELRDVKRLAAERSPQISPALVVTFFATVVVPVLVAFIYAYFRVKGAG